MTREEYAAYLRTPGWKDKASKVMRRDGRICRCGDRADHVHHLTYERIGDERLTDLVAICDPCHAKIHRLTTAGSPLKQASMAILLRPDAHRPRRPRAKPAPSPDRYL